MEELKDFNNTMIPILKTKFNQLKLTLSNLYPIERRKRGLFNFIGSGIKFITGNLDEEDAKKIFEEIETLKQNNQILLKQNNDQVDVNQVLIQKFNNLTDLINDHQKKVKDVFELRLKAKINGIVNTVEINHNIYHLIFYIDILQTHLDVIGEALLTSKAGFIPKNILETKEIDLAYKILNSQHVNVISYEEIYEYCSLKALYNNSQIIFIIQIPHFLKQEFTFILLEPIPTSGYKSIIPPNRYALYGGEETYFSKEKCTSINGNFICNLEELINITGHPCYSPILRGNQGNCSYTHQAQSEIKQLYNQHLILKNFTVKTFENTCNYKKELATSTILIKFNNCSIIINGLYFKDESVKFIENWHILPLHNIKIKETELIDPINLMALSKLHVKNREKIDLISTTHKIHLSTTMSILSIFFIIFIALIIKFRRSFLFKFKPSNLSNSAATSIDHKMITPISVASTEGGGVK